MRVLVLGGTTEASALARALAEARIDAVFSYAGRTDSPVAQPLPTRTGGFGGAEGLCHYLQAGAFTHLVDATHPFAVQMTHNAVAACAAAGVSCLGFERAAWQAGQGDKWQSVPDIAAAAAALPEAPRRVFLAIGKQTLAAFATKPQHHYLLRLVDPPQALPLPDVAVVLARGPFGLSGDIALLRDHRIDLIVAKNSGGSGAQAKLEAARTLGLAVVMVDRPFAPARQVVSSVAQVLDWLHHGADLGV